MKIIITENQFEKIAEKYKPILFKYWNSNGPSLSRQMYKILGIDLLNAYKLEVFFQEFLVEWFGGDEKFIEYLKGIEGNTYNILDGGYNFEIILDEVTVNEYQVYLDVRVKPGGTVTLIFDENEPTLSLEDAITNNKFGWEVNSEISEVIHNKFFKYFSDLGITIEDIDVDFM